LFLTERSKNVMLILCLLATKAYTDKMLTLTITYLHAVNKKAYF